MLRRLASRRALVASKLLVYKLGIQSSTLRIWFVIVASVLPWRVRAWQHHIYRGKGPSLREGGVGCWGGWAGRGPTGHPPLEAGGVGAGDRRRQRSLPPFKILEFQRSAQQAPGQALGKPPNQK